MTCAVLEQLAAALDAVAALDPAALADAELHELVVGLGRQRDRLAGVTAPLLARWDAAGLWSGDGSRSASTRLARECRASTRTAGVDLRRARQLTRMPHVAEAVAAGRISMDLVDLLGRAAQPERHATFAAHEATLVRECSVLRHAEAARVVDYWIQRADARGYESDAARLAASASLHASTTFEGTVRIDGTLDPIGGAVVTTELARLEREQFLADRRTGCTRTPSQRRAAALVEMATRSASTPPGSRRPQPLFTVVVGDESLARLCELATGTVIAPGQLLPHLDHAALESIVFADAATVISASRRRTFTGAVRRAVEVHDRHCRHPSGCDVPVAGCDVDHVVPASRGGVTTQFNGRLECTTHNRHRDKHDHDARPLPPRDVTYLDHARARLRWQLLHEPPEPDDEPSPSAAST